MNFINWSTTNCLAVKQSNKFAVYVSNSLNLDQHHDLKVYEFIVAEITKYVETYDHPNLLHDYLSNMLNGGLFLFDSQTEMQKFYSIFEQSLTDSSSVYACTYDNNGNCLTENT